MNVHLGRVQIYVNHRHLLLVLQESYFLLACVGWVAVDSRQFCRGVVPEFYLALCASCPSRPTVPQK
jgi:hypothetical protein